jgi:type IV pilus assembly protein PilA
MKKVRNKQGFTLIELMATVAIIGVLAAIAIPNYLKYQRKARQAEAKILLGSAFLSEKAINQDQHSYTGCVVQAGFGSDATNNFYAVGFGSNGVSTSLSTNCGPYTGSGGTNQSADAVCNYFSWKAIQGSPVKWAGVSTCALGTAGNSFISASQSLQTAPTVATLDNATNKTGVTFNTFTLGAAGSISDGVNSLDMWQIDYNKTIYQVNDGTQ